MITPHLFSRYKPEILPLKDLNNTIFLAHQAGSVRFRTQTHLHTHTHDFTESPMLKTLTPQIHQSSSSKIFFPGQVSTGFSYFMRHHVWCSLWWRRRGCSCNIPSEDIPRIPRASFLRGFMTLMPAKCRIWPQSVLTWLWNGPRIWIW